MRWFGEQFSTTRINCPLTLKTTTVLNVIKNPCFQTIYDLYLYLLGWSSPYKLGTTSDLTTNVASKSADDLVSSNHTEIIVLTWYRVRGEVLLCAKKVGFPRSGTCTYAWATATAAAAKSAAAIMWFAHSGCCSYSCNMFFALGCCCKSSAMGQHLLLGLGLCGGGEWF